MKRFLVIAIFVMLSSIPFSFAAADCVFSSTQTISSNQDCGNVTVQSGVTLNIDSSVRTINFTFEGNFTIEPTAVINGVGRGFAAQAGPGGSGFGGGGHGGTGVSGGGTYGSALHPSTAGSGGVQGAGGSAVWIIGTGVVNNSGLIDVSGTDCSGNHCGAGGSIFVNATTIVGTGDYEAEGGLGNRDGGGGRIALWANNVGTLSSGLLSVVGPSTAGEGTIVLIDKDDNDLIFMINSRLETVDFPTRFINYNRVLLKSAIVDSGTGFNLNTSVLSLDSGSSLTAEQSLNVTFTKNITIASGAIITGYANGYAAQEGPGGSPSPSSNDAGTHGGKGVSSIKATYGSALNPVTMGSGSDDSSGGALFRAVSFVPGANFTNNGRIDMNGSRGGDEGGAGGSIFVNVSNVFGSGIYVAAGGNTPSTSRDGGGGRIALWAGNAEVITASQVDVTGPTTAGDGTALILDTDSNDFRFVNSGRFEAVDFPAGAINYNNIIFESAAVDTNVNFTINASNFTMTGGSSLEASNYLNFTFNGNFTIGPGSVIEAVGNGFALKKGPGGSTFGGGGHGGAGESGGGTYGSALNPSTMGSGGVHGAGGGAIRISGTGTFNNSGVIDVNGSACSSNHCGAGGSIFVNSTTIIGGGGYFAKGGVGNRDGGGGRIALWANNAATISSDSINVVGPGSAADGTKVLVDVDDDGIIALPGFDSETDDIVDGQIRKGLFTGNGVVLTLNTNTLFNMSSSFNFIGGTITGGSNNLGISAQLVNLSNAFVDADVVDIQFGNNFDDNGTVYQASVSTLAVEKIGVAKINWSSSVSSVGNLSQAITFGDNQVSVNSSLVAGLNTSATITLKTSFATQPDPLYDPLDTGNFITCPGSICTPQSFDAASGEFTFTVTHFTGFSSGVGAALTIYDDTDALGGSNTRDTSQFVGFFANYTNSSDSSALPGECKINISSLSINAQSMTFNSTTGLYNFTAGLFAAGTPEWNVTCTNEVGLGNLTANDTVTINEFTPPAAPEFSEWAVMILLTTCILGFFFMRKQELQ
jgi:hypothetical protein